MTPLVILGKVPVEVEMLRVEVLAVVGANRIHIQTTVVQVVVTPVHLTPAVTNIEKGNKLNTNILSPDSLIYGIGISMILGVVVWLGFKKNKKIMSCCNFMSGLFTSVWLLIVLLGQTLGIYWQYALLYTALFFATTSSLHMIIQNWGSNNGNE